MPDQSEGPVVLVVDDLELVRSYVGRVLATAGYRVLGAKDGNDALLMLATTTIHLVLTDLRMPSMSGLQLAALASLLPACPTILFISGEDSPPAGVSSSHFLQKPFTGDALKSKVAALLDREDERRNAS